MTRKYKSVNKFKNIYCYFCKIHTIYDIQKSTKSTSHKCTLTGKGTTKIMTTAYTLLVQNIQKYKMQLLTIKIFNNCTI